MKDEIDRFTRHAIVRSFLELRLCPKGHLSRSTSENIKGRVDQDMFALRHPFRPTSLVNVRNLRTTLPSWGNRRFTLFPSPGKHDLIRLQQLLLITLGTLLFIEAAIEHFILYRQACYHQA